MDLPHLICMIHQTIKQWKELGDDIKFKPSVQSFKKHLNDFIRPLGITLFGICDKYGTKLITKIRVTFSDLRGHRFNDNFNCDNPLCSAWKMKPLFIFPALSALRFPTFQPFSAKYQTLLALI